MMANAYKLIRSEYTSAIHSESTQITNLVDADSDSGVAAWYQQFLLAGPPASKKWRPRAVAVERSGTLAGIVLFKERTFAGLPTGVFYAEGVFGKMVLARPQDQEAVFTVALKALLASDHVRGIRLVVPADGPEVMALAETTSSTRVHVSRRNRNDHDLLLLSNDYGNFLDSLGYKTRRNFRYYRRQSEARGNVFVSQMSFRDFQAAVAELRPACALGPTDSLMREWLSMMPVVETPLMVGLRRTTGEWLSVAGGWCHGERAFLLFQLNKDSHYSRESLSIVLRSYLIEKLIESGSRELLFWGGSTAPLSRYSKKVSEVAVYLDADKPEWRLFRGAADRLRNWIPKWCWRSAAWAEWIVPPPGLLLAPFMYLGALSTTLDNFG
jgi:hypothetical protein